MSHTCNICSIVHKSLNIGSIKDDRVMSVSRRQELGISGGNWFCALVKMNKKKKKIRAFLFYETSENRRVVTLRIYLPG